MSFIIVGYISALIGILKYRRNKLLKENGMRIIANVTYKRKINSLYLNNKHPYKFYCEYIDGKRYKYHSDLVWSYKIWIHNINEVPVYIDSKNPKRYFVDVDEVL